MYFSKVPHTQKFFTGVQCSTETSRKQAANNKIGGQINKALDTLSFATTRKLVPDNMGKYFGQRSQSLPPPLRAPTLS
jgi:hypothetical protein